MPARNRMKVGERIFNGLEKSVAPESYKTYLVMFEAKRLFREAAKAFDAEAFAGAVLICRAVLETGFYLYLTRPMTDLGISAKIPTTLDGNIRRVEFEEASKGITKKVKFTEKHLAAIRRIQEHGNFVAHLGHRRTKELMWYGEQVELLMMKSREQRLSEKAWQKEHQKVFEDTRAWIRPDEALRDLRDTASILLKVFRAIASDYDKAFPWSRKLKEPVSKKS